MTAATVPARPADPWATSRDFAIDAGLTGGLVVLTVLLPATFLGPLTAGLAGAGYSPAVDLALGLALTVPTLWRRRAPVQSAAVIGAILLLQVLTVDRLLLADVAVLVAVHALTAYGPPRAGRVGLTVGLAATLPAAYAWVTPFVGPELLFLAVLLGVPVLTAWALGDVTRSRAQRGAALAERARLIDVERDQEMRLVATAERTRIARELHDVVAHSLSVVIAQADGGRYAGRTDPDAATAALEAIAATGRQALGDMRSLLGVLREGGAEQYRPQPGIADVSTLVEEVRASGLDVDLLVEGPPQPLPAGPQLAGYRIVQESLTNVLKHAGEGARAWVRLDWRPEALEISVVDDGRGGAAAPDGSGSGLTGMRERAALHGGWLQAGPRPGGGFSVHAGLPYRPVR